MSIVSRLGMKRRIFAAALCAGVLGAAAPANAADLGLLHGHRVKHVRISHTYWNWRDRCAYAGYYCLYAEYGYVYAYPFDDRPIAHAYYRRRFR